MQIYNFTKVSAVADEPAVCTVLTAITLRTKLDVQCDELVTELS